MSEILTLVNDLLLKDKNNMRHQQHFKIEE